MAGSPDDRGSVPGHGPISPALLAVSCPNPECQLLNRIRPRGAAVLRCSRCRATLTIAGSTQEAPVQPEGQEADVRQIGRFQIRQGVGAGAFGKVYRAFDPDLGREVAVKVAHEGTLSSPRRVRRFLGDARAAACLRHPNIVPIFDVGADNGRHFIASAFIEGETLAASLRRGRPDLRRGVAIVRDLARALAYAHEQGIVHRDVKPANVVLDEHGRPHLIDFGLARRPESLDAAEEGEDDPGDPTGEGTLAGAVLGTPSYMAPEAASGQGHPARPTLDQYSLGVTLYEVLTGRLPPPFEGPARIVLYNVVHTPAPPPRLLRPDLPLDLECVCNKAMARRPEGRYPSCRDLADDLDRWLDGRPVSVRRLAATERLVRWARSEPRLAFAVGLAALMLVLVAGVLAFSAYRLDRAREHETRAREQEARAREDEVRAREDEARQRRQAEQARREAEKASKLAEERAEQAEKAQQKTAKVLGERDAALRQAEVARQEVAENLRTARRELYFSLVDRAARELRDNHVERARQHLKDCPRPWGWEWRHLWAECQRDHRRESFSGSLALTDDGRWIAWTNRRGEVLLRTTTYASAKSPTRRLLVRSGPRSLAFSDDSRWLAVGCAGGRLELWRVEDATHRVGATIHRGGTISSVAFTANGNHIAAAVGREVHVLGFQPDGAARLEAGPSLSTQAEVRSVSFVPDPKRRVVIISTRTEALMHDFDADKDLLRLPAFTAGAIHPKGDCKAAAKEGGRVVVLDQNDREMCQFAGHQCDVLDLRISRTDQVAFAQLATLDENNVLKLWEVLKKNSREPRELFSILTTAFAMSQDGRTLAWYGADNSVRLGYPNLRPSQSPVYDMETGGAVEGRGDEQTFDSYAQYIHGLAHSSDGKFLLTASSIPRPGKDGSLAGLEGGEMVIWDAATGKQLARSPQRDSPIYAVACSRQGTVAWAGQRTSLSLWELPGKGAIRQLRAAAGGTNALAFDPDGRWLLVGEQNGAAVVWDVARGEVKTTLVEKGPEVYAVAWSADGRALAVADRAGDVRLWRWNDLHRPMTLCEAAGKKAHASIAHALAFSADSTRLATGGADERINIWDVASGKLLRELRGHTRAVIGLAFSPAGPPDEERLASCGRDRTVRLWLPATGREALSLPVGSGLRPVMSFSPGTGEELLAGTVQGVRRWRAPPLPKQ